MTPPGDTAYLSSEDLLAFYENEAKEVPIFGSLREISLVENIAHVLPRSFSNLIDVGCGEGYLLYALQKKWKDAQYFGFDLTQGRITATQKNVPSALLLRGDVLHLPFPDNAFDIVVCSELLEHMEAYQHVVDELLRITRKRLVITVPNELPLVKIMCPKCKTKHYYDGHVNYFTAEKLRMIFDKRKDVNVVAVRKFHTIYTYNRVTLKFPKCLRLFFDQSIQRFQKKIPFLKPNYLMIMVDKK